MRKIFVCLLLCLCAVTLNAQFLFRVSGGEQEKPSYLLGTIHVLPASLLDSIPSYIEAESQCQQMFVEIDTKNNGLLDSLKNVGKQIMYLPEGKTLTDYMTKEQLDLLNDRIKKAFPFSVNDSALAKMFYKFNPSIIITTLSLTIVTDIIKDIPDYASIIQKKDSGLDAGCVKRAKERGMTLGNLDEIMPKDSLNKLQDVMSQNIETYVDSLVAFLNNYDRIKQETLESTSILVQAAKEWKAGDYEAFAANPYWTETVVKIPLLVKNRNEKWLPKMCAAMRESPTMFAFGAAHLIGPDGIIQMLRNAGYKVEQVK